VAVGRSTRPRAHYRHTTQDMLGRVIETVETYLRTALASVPQACPKHSRVCPARERPSKLKLGAEPMGCTEGRKGPVKPIRASRRSSAVQPRSAVLLPAPRPSRRTGPEKPTILPASTQSHQPRDRTVSRDGRSVGARTPAGGATVLRRVSHRAAQHHGCDATKGAGVDQRVTVDQQEVGVVAGPQPALAVP
jgi:hypothetical protein